MKDTTDIKVNLITNPLTGEFKQVWFKQGRTLRDILSEVYTNDRLLKYLHVEVDGKVVSIEDAAFVVPKECVLVNIRPGGGATALIVTAIVSAIVSFAVAYYFARKFGAQKDEGDAYFIRGQRNRDRRYEPMPIIIGKRRVVPDLAAQPWTEINGSDQYLRVLLNVGHGPLKIEDIKIGDTSIDQFGDDVEFQIYDGWQNFSELSLFPNDVVTEEVGRDFETTNTPEIRTTAVDTDRIEVDFTFPQGLGRSRDGGITSSRIEFLLEYRKVGESTWLNAKDVITQSGVQFPENIDVLSGSNVESFISGELTNVVSVGTNVSKGQIVATILTDTGFGIEQFDLRSEVSGVVSQVNFSVGQTVPANTTILSIDAGKDEIEVEASTNRPFAGSFAWNVERDQYEVKVTLTRRVLRTSRFNLMQWTELKSFRDEPPIVERPGVYIAMRIKATERLSGSLDRVNCLATSMVPQEWEADWSAWQEETLPPSPSEFIIGSRFLRITTLETFQAAIQAYRERIWAASQQWKESENPAELARWILQGPFLKVRIENSKLDLDSFDDWRDYANQKQLSCNAIVENEKTLANLLNKIGSTANAELIVRNGQYAWAIDRPRSEYTAVFTFKNSNSITATREFLEPVDGFRVTFDNKDFNFEEDEIVVPYDDLTEITGNYETVDLWGITDYEQAYKQTRRLLAERRLRQEAYSVTANVEAADVTRGDLVLLQQPVIGIGRAAGRIRSVDGNTIIVDEQCSTENGNNFGLQIVKPDHTVFVTEVVSVQDGKILTVSNAGGIEVGDRFMFGTIEQESLECLVQEVAPNSDLSFDIKLVNYAPAIYQVDGEPIPAYDPIVDMPEAEDRLPQPTIRYIKFERSRNQTETGEFKLRAIIGYSYPGTYNAPDFQVQLQYRKQGEPIWTSAERSESHEREFVVEGLRDRQEYSFRIRSVSGSASSDWNQINRFVESNVEEDPEMPVVTGLELYDPVGTNEFTGNDVKIIWRQTSSTRSFELGDEPAGGDDGGFDAYFKDYLIEVVDPETNEELRSEFTKDTSYIYDFEKNVEDGGPRRRLKFRVYIRGQNNQIGEFRAITVSNPQPPLHTGFSITEAFTGATFRWNPNLDVDFKGTQIFVDTDSGFTPSENNLVYDGPDTEANVTGLDSETTYYMRYRVYDSFGREAANESGEFVFQTRSVLDVLDLGEWAQVPAPSREAIEAWLAGDVDEFGEPLYEPKIVAGQIISGVISATELIQSEGLIRVTDDINDPNFFVTMGPEIVGDRAYLLNYRDTSNNVIFGLDEFGGARFTGDVAITGGSGITNLTDTGSLATKDNVDLSTGDVINKSANNIDESVDRKWAAESGADVTAGKPINTLDTLGTDFSSGGQVAATFLDLDEKLQLSDRQMFSWRYSSTHPSATIVKLGEFTITNTNSQVVGVGRIVPNRGSSYSDQFFEFQVRTGSPVTDISHNFTRITTEKPDRRANIELWSDDSQPNRIVVVARYTDDNQAFFGMMDFFHRTASVDFEQASRNSPEILSDMSGFTELEKTAGVTDFDADEVYVNGNPALDLDGKAENAKNVGNKSASDIEDGVDRVLAGLDANGNLQRVIEGATLPFVDPSEPGLALNRNNFGYWNGSNWVTVFTSSGDAIIGDTGTNNFVFWDQSEGELTVSGDIVAADITGSTITGSLFRTAATGERFEISESDNRARFIDSINREIVTIGSTNEDGELYGVIVDSFDSGIFSRASNVGGRFLGRTTGVEAVSTSVNALALTTTVPTSTQTNMRIENGGGSQTVSLRAGDNPSAGHLQVFRSGWRSVLLTGPSGSVGTVVFARDNSGVARNFDGFNDTVSGSNLQPAHAGGGRQSDTLEGTWRILGFSSGSGDQGPTTLWVRIA